MQILLKGVTPDTGFLQKVSVRQVEYKFKLIFQHGSDTQRL